jgi:hypothetical protein
MDDAELAQLQAALVDVLRRASSPDDALAMLAQIPLSQWAHRWLASSDPRSIETAIALVQRWTTPDQPPTNPAQTAEG